MANTAVKLQTSSVYTGPDPVSSAMLADVEATTAKYVALSTELSAATGDRAKAIETWIQSSDDAEAAKLREVLERAKAKLQELAEASVKNVTLTETEVNAKRDELKVLKTAVQDKRKAATLVANTTNIDTVNVLAALASIEDPTKGKGGVKTGTPGPKGPRVSATVKVTGFGGETDTQTFDGLSKAATAVGVETKAVQEAYAKAAAVPFENIAKVDKPLSFVVSVGTGDNSKSFTFVTTPKPRNNAKATFSSKAEADAKAQGETTETPADVQA
jgi:hypothetical protein